MSCCDSAIPIGNGQTVDGEDRLPLFIGADAQLVFLLGGSTSVYSRIHIRRATYRNLLLDHFDKDIVTNAYSLPEVV